MKTIHGWLLSKKRIKNGFSGVVFVDSKKEKFCLETRQSLPEKIQEFDKIKPWTIISLLGRKNKQSFFAKSFKILNNSTKKLPFDPFSSKKISFKKRLDYRFIDLRNPKNQDIFQVRMKTVSLFRDYFKKAEYMELDSPKIVSIGLESNITPFTINYFGKKACLSKGPQTYKTMLLAAGWNRVFEIGPIFRIEKKYSNRHVAEFTAIDFDFSFVNSEFDVMKEEEKILKFVINNLQKEASKELINNEIKLKKVHKIPQLESNKAKKILAKNGKFLSPYDSFDSEAEAILGKYALKTFGSELLFLYNYPWKDRFFYYQKKENDSIGSKSFDVLFRGVEIGTSAQKEHRKKILLSQAIEKGLNISKLKTYLHVFNYSMPTYGGGGIGLDRLLQKIFSADNIREVIQFPRDSKRLNP
ncbi:MAG: aspartate--tRNA(Asn) ligase [archaeon]|nr:aspartate--tRNA(Asn) ligase [archaeon]